MFIRPICGYEILEWIKYFSTCQYVGTVKPACDHYAAVGQEGFSSSTVVASQVSAGTKSTSGWIVEFGVRSGAPSHTLDEHQSIREHGVEVASAWLSHASRRAECSSRWIVQFSRCGCGSAASDLPARDKDFA